MIPDPGRASKAVQTIVQGASPFDRIRRVTEDGAEFWSARELCTELDYETWRNFAAAVNRAQAAAENTGTAGDHFVDANKMVAIGSGSERRLDDWHLTRYGAYLVVMNGDPRKPEIAAAQSYFAIRTREAEVAKPLTEDEIVHQALSITAKRVEALTARVAELEPKAELADDYLTAQGGARLVSQVAKTFGLKQRDLRRFLIDERFIFPRHSQCGDVQYDHYAQYAHHFLPRETVVQHQFGSCSHYTLYVLPRGVELIGKRLREKGVI